jgi:hypothetical protein
MTKEIPMTNSEKPNAAELVLSFGFRHSLVIRASLLVIRRLVPLTSATGFVLFHGFIRF